MGMSPWKTRYQLWLEKTGIVSADSGENWATERGNQLEPMARADYELRYGLDMPVVFAEHVEYPYLRASLDGYNAEHKIILEIKCPSEKDHALAKTGVIPDKYYPQLQHQLLVTGANAVHYYSYDGIRGEKVVCLPDRDYIFTLLDQLKKFWWLVETLTAPEKVREDFKPIRFKGAAALCKAGDTDTISAMVPEVGLFRVNDFYFENRRLIDVK